MGQLESSIGNSSYGRLSFNNTKQKKQTRFIEVSCGERERQREGERMRQNE